MRQQAAWWLRAIAPFAFVVLGCGTEPNPLPAAAHFGVVRATSSTLSYSAQATFRRDVTPNCSISNMGDGCVVAACQSSESSGSAAVAGNVTIQGAETVVLSSDNGWLAEAERSLFGNGDEVLFDLGASSDVPGFRSGLRAPSSTSLVAPLPESEGAPLALTAGESLDVEWVPGNNGLMKFYAGAGLVGVSCEWTVSNGEARISAATLAELPASDGSDSRLAFWTEQNDVVRKDDWEFLLLLSGEAAGSDFGGYTSAD